MTSTASVERAAALVHAHGREATSFQTLAPDFHWYFHGRDAGVAYVEVPGAWVAAGSPLAARSRVAETAQHFVAAARAAGRRPVFFAAEGDLGLVATPLGADAVWDPTSWAATLRATPSLREQLRRARAKGVHVGLLAADERAALRPEIEQVVERWRATRGMAAMGFVVRVAPFERPRERRVLVAKRHGAVVAVGVVIPVPGRHGLFVESLVRDPSAPNGTVELVFDAAIHLALAEHRAMVTLGLAPLAGDVPAALRLARSLGSVLYDFDGLRAFKAKLRPTSWEPRYLVREPRTGVVPAFRAALAAFAGGSLVGFGARTAARVVTPRR